MNIYTESLKKSNIINNHIITKNNITINNDIICMFSNMSEHCENVTNNLNCNNSNYDKAKACGYKLYDDDTNNEYNSIREIEKTENYNNAINE